MMIVDMLKKGSFSYQNQNINYMRLEGTSRHQTNNSGLLLREPAGIRPIAVDCMVLPHATKTPDIVP